MSEHDRIVEVLTLIYRELNIANEIGAKQVTAIEDLTAAVTVADATNTQAIAVTTSAVNYIAQLAAQLSALPPSTTDDSTQLEAIAADVTQHAADLATANAALQAALPGATVPTSPVTTAVNQGGTTVTTPDSAVSTDNDGTDGAITDHDGTATPAQPVPSDTPVFDSSVAATGQNPIAAPAPVDAPPSFN